MCVCVSPRLIHISVEVCDLLCDVVWFALPFVCACGPFGVCVGLLCVNTRCVCVRVCEFVCDVVLRFV